MSDTYRAGIAATLGLLGITKEAASRIDKALAAGQLAFKDVMPELRAPRVGSYGHQKTVQEWKRLWRDSAHAPAPRSAEELARTRALNAAKVEQAAHNTGVRGVKVVREDQGDGWMRAQGPHVPIAQSRRGNIQAVVPTDSAAYVRESVHEATTPAQRVPRRPPVTPASKSGTKPTKRPAIVSTANTRSTPLNAPEDPTLMHAFTQHEIGEARTLKKAPGTRYAPHASHIGVEPILRENLALVGDPAAQQLSSSLRRLHPDDAYVQRLVRQVGGTPDSPIPLEGRRANALHERLRATESTLSPQSRELALMLQKVDPRGSKAQQLIPPQITKDMAALDTFYSTPRRVPPRRAGSPPPRRPKRSPEEQAAYEANQRLNEWMYGKDQL